MVYPYLISKRVFPIYLLYKILHQVRDQIDYQMLSEKTVYRL